MLADRGVAWAGDQFLEAVRTGDLPTVRLFVSGKIPIHGAKSQGRPLPVMLSLNDYNAPEVLRILAEGELDIDHIYELYVAGPLRTTLLGWAIVEGNDALCAALLDQKADPNIPIQTPGMMGLSKSTFPLASAIQWQRWDTAAALIDHGADPTAGDFLAYREGLAIAPRVRNPAEREKFQHLMTALEPKGIDGERINAQRRVAEIEAELTKVALEGLQSLSNPARKRQLDQRYDELQKERAKLTAHLEGLNARSN